MGLSIPKAGLNGMEILLLSNLYCAEYLNTGPGAAAANGVNWPGFHVVNTPQQASPFAVTSFIQGDSWIPATGVSFRLGM